MFTFTEYSIISSARTHTHTNTQRREPEHANKSDFVLQQLTHKHSQPKVWHTYTSKVKRTFLTSFNAPLAEHADFASCRRVKMKLNGGSLFRDINSEQRHKARQSHGDEQAERPHRVSDSLLWTYTEAKWSLWIMDWICVLLHESEVNWLAENRQMSHSASLHSIKFD